MPLPIADLYARPRSPYLAPSSSSPSPSRPAISSSPSAPSSLPSVASLDLRSRPPLKRATLSLDPRRDDPFAPASPPLPRTGDTGSVGIDAGHETPLGGEEWRVSESDERIVADSAKENVEGDDDDATVRRRTSTSSFLRSLTRPLRSSTSSRTSVSGSLFSSKPKNPRRTRSSIQLDRISSPLPPSLSTAPPDPHPERTKGELLSVGEAVERRRSWLVQQHEGEERAAAEPPQRAATPAFHAQTISFASRPLSSSLRASRTERGLNRRASLGSLFFPRKQDKGDGCDQAEEAHANVHSVPSTSSRKALKVLGRLVGGGGTRQQGEPYSPMLPNSDGVVGLALTTDAPTRRIVPDNARNSFATSASSTSSLRSRILSSGSSVTVSPSQRTRLASSATILERHAEEEGEDIVVESSVTSTSRPLSPPPNIPLPPLPTSPEAPHGSTAPYIQFTAPTPGTTPAPRRAPNRPPLPPGLAPEPSPSVTRTPSPARAPVPPGLAPDSAATNSTFSSARSVSPEPSGAVRPSSCASNVHEMSRIPRPPRPPRSAARPSSAQGHRPVGTPAAVAPVVPATADLPRLRVLSPLSRKLSRQSTQRSPQQHPPVSPSHSGPSGAAPSLVKDRAPVSSADLRAAHASSASAQTVKGKLRASTTTRAADSPRPDPLVSLYLVGGLSKDPRNWIEADAADGFEATRLDAEGRRWKAEVLGVMSGAKDGEEGEVRRLGRDEMEKVQARALKLAFDRDVEVIASPSQPSATTSFFSFTASRASPASSPRQQQYHCVSLLVWSHCDDTRATAIASLLQQRITKAQLEAEAVKRGARAARAGQRLSKVLLEQLRQDEPAADDAATTTGGAPSETDAGTDGRASLELDDRPPLPVGPFLDHLDRSPLWLPYAIVLVSTSPLYTLLIDAVRLSWARYHSHLASHSLQMDRLLNMPVQRPGEVIRVPVSVAEGQQDTFFSAVMPGEIDWTTGVPCSRNFPLWPVFKCLHADNLLTIAELALAPLGRIVFLSKHSIMLCLATMAFQTILELRDWKGLVLPTCHARDLKLFLEDPGPWLLGLPTSPANASLLSSLAPEIVLVDLDANLVSCACPFPCAVSTGSVRDKALKRLEGVVGTVGRHEVPLELIEAFSGGRFRPFSVVEVAGEAREAERLKPDVTWQWDEQAVLKELDSILAETPRAGLVGKLLRLKNPRKSVDLDTNLKHIQAVVRDHASTFVERRDSLEGEINKANRRLAVLMNQSAEWQRSFSVFKEFSDKAAKDSVELKVRLENERREARRLTGQLAADREQQAQLEANLEQVERARGQALHELARIDELRRDLERQRALLAQEVQSIVLGADDETSPVFQAVYSRIEALSQRSETSSRPGTALSSRRPSSRLARQPSYLDEYLPKAVAEEDEDDEAFEVLDEEARLDTMRLAFQETFRAISSRLSLALQAAGDFRGTALSNMAHSHASSSIGTISPSRTVESDATLVSQGTPVGCRPPLSPEVGPFDGKTRPFSPTGSSALGFQPKTLTLTPPVSPEMDDLATPASFVTIRSNRRIPSHSHSAHQRQSSLGAASVLSASTFSTVSTPLARSPSAASPSGLVRPASRASILSHSRSASQISYLSSSVEYEDARSFVSGFDYTSRAGTPAAAHTFAQSPEYKHGDHMEELAQPDSPLAARELLALAARSYSPELARRRRPGHGHGRQDSFALDAPPVALFTRTGSLRGSKGGEGNEGDLRGRVRRVVERYEQRGV